MGNPQHLEWLLEGVEAWNASRLSQDFRPDLSFTDVRGAFLTANKIFNNQQTPLAGVNLRQADLRDTFFTASNLAKAQLQEAVLTNASLAQSNLQYADFTGADLQNTILLNASFFGAKLSGTILQDAILTGANLKEADLTLADFSTIYNGAKGQELARPRRTDLRPSKGLTQEQIDTAKGDMDVLLPSHLRHPESWKGLLGI